MRGFFYTITLFKLFFFHFFVSFMETLPAAGFGMSGWDQTQKSDNLGFRKNQRLKRIGLGNAAIAHWTKAGHAVENDMMIQPLHHDTMTPGDIQMANYIIIDRYSGYIWGDTRDLNGKSVSTDSITEACRLLDESISLRARTYEEVSRLPGDQGYAVYRVDVNGSEAVPVVRDGRDQDEIDAVIASCPLVGYVEWKDPIE